MIPPFDPVSGNLPPGVHEATWDELLTRYGYTPYRLRLIAGLKRALDMLRAAGCTRVYVDGSFTTSKEQPGDFDVCWESDYVDWTLLDLLLLDFSNARAAQKSAFGGELFPADWNADGVGTTFLDYFQEDKHTGAATGIVALDLGDLP